MFSEHDRHTLVVGDEDHQNGGGDSPQTRIANGVDDILDLRRNWQIAVPDAGERRGEASSVGLHGSCGEKAELQPRDRFEFTASAEPSGDEAFVPFHFCSRRAGRQEANERASRTRCRAEDENKKGRTGKKGQLGK